MRVVTCVSWVACVCSLAVGAGSAGSGPARAWALAPSTSNGPHLGPGASIAPAGGDSPRAAGKRGDRKAAIRRCVDYSQREDDEGMNLRLSNRCGRDLQCSITWEVACQSEDEPRKAGSVFDLPAASTDGAYATAASCGDDGWEIRKVRWSCSDPAE